MLLSFDDLVRIFEYLDLKDQLNVARACPNFYDIIVNSIWRRRFTEVCVSQAEKHEAAFKTNEQIKKLSKEDYQEFFRWNVQNLRKLKLDNLIAQYWKHFLGHNLMRPGIDYYLTFHYTRLTELACVNVSLIFHDGTMRHMAAHCPLIERLTISSKNVTGQYLMNFRYLRNLSLENCSLKICHLMELIQNSESLETLNVCGNAELLSIMVPTWGRTLKEIRLDEEAFIKQFAWEHQLPKRFGKIRTFGIAGSSYENDNENSPKSLPLLQSFDNHIKKFKLLSSSADIQRALQSLYLKRGAPIFENLTELHIPTNRVGLESLKFFFDTQNLKTLHIYFSSIDYDTHEVIRLLELNEKLFYLGIHLVHLELETVIWQFLDDIISFKRQVKIFRPLKLEFQQPYEFNMPCLRNFRNVKDLKKIQQKFYNLKKNSIYFDFGLEISFKTNSRHSPQNSQQIEICFLNGELKPTMEILNFIEPENIFIEPETSVAENSHNFLNGKDITEVITQQENLTIKC